MEIKDNHIIIGLGGTGGSILRAFRKRVFSEFAFDERQKLPLGYVYMDSSNSMMKHDDQSWKILGENAQLGKNNQVFIGNANLRAQLDNINRYPGIKGWIGDKVIWDEIAPHIVEGAAAAQRRRVGRFLFSVKASDFLFTLQNQVKDVQEKTGQKPVTFHIFTGLAGGTGSGSIIDTITQIRKFYHFSSQFKIFVYVFVPEQTPKKGWDKGYYHANGYAALVELNALSVGNFKPHDVTGQTERVEDDSFFNGCYLFSNINENGIIVDIEEQLPSIVSDFLFQKLTLTNGSKSKEVFNRTENFENSVDEKYENDQNTLKKVRSRMFLSFGIKRIEIPEEEITEYITYNFEKQTLLQFKFNNWSDDFGFREELSNDSDSKVSDLVNNNKQTISNWYMSDDHITLSKAILKSDENQKWKTIIEDWNAIIALLKSTAWDNQNDKTTPLNQLSKLCEERYEKNFRKVGVPEFYKLKKQTKKDIAKEITDIIERDLFQQWKTGQWSSFEISKILNLLITVTGNRLTGIATKLNQIGEEIEKQIINKQKSEVEWSKAGPFSVLIFGKHKKIFEAYGVILQTLYTRKTEQESWNFAKELLAELLNQLQMLNSEINGFSDKISKMTETADKMIASRCQDKQLNNDSFKQAIVRFYDVNKVKEFTKEMVTNKEVQQNLSSNIRNTIIEPLGTEPTFSKFNEKISPGFLSDTIDKLCKERAVTEHNNIITNKKNRLIGISIVDKLYEQFYLDYEGLKNFLRPLSEYGGTFINFNDGEIKGDAEQIGVKIKLGQTIVVIPKSDDDKKNFVNEKLKPALKEVFSEDLIFDDKSEKQNELSVMKIIYCFPLRGVQEVKMLREKYEQLLSSKDKTVAKIVLHMEGDGTQYPRIFLPTQAELLQENERAINNFLPYYLIAKGMNIVTNTTQEGTGKNIYGVNKVDSRGRQVGLLEIGSKMTDILNSYSEELEREIIDIVKEKLAGDYLHVDKRKEIEKGVTDALNYIILKECSGMKKSQIYERFFSASDIAYSMIEN